MSVVGSYTLFSDFRNCPHKAYRARIAKDLPEKPKSPEMSHGIRVHNALDARIKGNKGLPEDLVPLEPMAANFAERGAQTEVMLGVRADWTPCEFFATDVYIRGKIDVLLVDDPDSPSLAFIGDWKTGKVREDPLELTIHAMLLKAWIPTLQKIVAQYLWTAQLFDVLGKEHDVSDTRVAQNLSRDIMGIIERKLQTGSQFEKTPNPLCGWCPVMDCEHNQVDKRK